MLNKVHLNIKQGKKPSVANHSSPILAGLYQLVLLVALLSFVFQSPAHSQNGSHNDIRYTLSPIASGTAWNSNLGLKDGFFYGGKLGIDFGPLLGLEVSYLTSGNLKTDFAQIDLRDTAGVIVGNQRVKVRRYGGDLIVRWPSDRIAPFAKIGGGVIRFEPESGQKVEKIDVKIGGGLDYIVSSRLRVRTAVEMNRFRLDRYTLAPGGAESGLYPIDAEAGKIRNNFSIGIGLDYAIGQSRFTTNTPSQNIRPFSVLEIEPLIGRLDFDDSRMSNATVLGAQIGGELNPWVGWGLYYWHAMESDLSDTRPLQSYGGEARFSLASKAGPQPYVTIGAGQLDFRSNFIDSEGANRDDKMALILGAGIRAEVFRGLQLNVSAHDFMYGEERLDRVSGAKDISHNWLLSGALVFGIGGSGKKARPEPIDLLPVYNAASKAVGKKDTTADAIQYVAPQDTTKATIQPLRISGTQPGYVSDKTVVIPVPLEGEIYIRYGKTSRDMGEAVFKEAAPAQNIITDTSGRSSVTSKQDSVISTIAPVTVPSIDTTSSTQSKPEIEQVAPISRSELNSLMDDFKLELSAMLAAQAVKPGEVGNETPLGRQPGAFDSTAFLAERDSVFLALKEELDASRQEQKRLDSLLRLPVAAVESPPDSLAEQRIQQEIANRVAATLASRTEGTGKEITQADLQNMMSTLTARMDSVTSKRAAIDSNKLRDQLQLEIVKQTKSQKEFQQAMQEYMNKHGERLQNEASPLPTIIVTPSSPSPQIIEKNEPPTVIIKPDTQYVFIRDTTGPEPAPLQITDLDTGVTSEEKDFIDLRPTAYTGFGLEKPKQFILGGRLDIGPVTLKEERLRLVPEFALGLGGGGVSVMVVMNAEYAIADIETGDYRIIPYARMGFGVLGFGGDISERDTEGVLNFTYGVSIDPRKTGLLRDIGNPALFIEHQIIDLFDLNRIALGLQWSR